MIDIKYIRNNTEEIRKAIIAKNEKDNLDKLIVVYKQHRRLQFDIDKLRSHQNRVSQVIAAKITSRDDCSIEISDMTDVAARMKDLTNELNHSNEEIGKRLLTKPNIPDASVPVVKKQSFNEVMSHWGKPVEYEFEAHDHLDLFRCINAYCYTSQPLIADNTVRKLA
ncbi:MAG: hypothetical protein PHN71_02230 [Candidatus Cloacimonetes bacterium]|nr:hypothetical protein [Candidatus Cloacimonadota bacterium]